MVAERLMTQDLWLFEKGKEKAPSLVETLGKELITIWHSSLFVLYIQPSLSLYFQSNDLVLLHGCHGLYP